MSSAMAEKYLMPTTYCDQESQKILHMFQLFTSGLGTRWHSWLWHCATSQKVTGSIPNGVIGIFHLHNPSGHTTALGLTQRLTEMSTRNISWGIKADSV
jgi:hypothetical protein